MAHYTYSQTPAFPEIIQVLQGLLSEKPAAQAQSISLQRPQVARMMCPELFFIIIHDYCVKGQYVSVKNPSFPAPDVCFPPSNTPVSPGISHLYDFACPPSSWFPITF